MKFLKSSGLLVIISSPSGAGKSSLARDLVDSDPNLSFSISFTTREKRRGELNGKDYFFVDISTFKNLSEKGDMLEYAKVFGNYYGTPKAPIDLGLMEGKDFVFDVDWQGGDQIRSSDFSENVVSIFIDDVVFQKAPEAFKTKVVLPILTSLPDLTIASAHQSLQISSADFEVARQLEIPVNTPTAEIRRVLCDPKGRVVYIVDATYRGDYIRLDMNLKS